MAIDRMASMRLPFAAPLLELRSSQPGASPQQIERSLEQWYFTQVASILKEDGSRDDLIARSIWLDADLVNLMVCLRHAHQPEENGRPADLLDWMVQPGSIRLDLLEQCISQPDVESCVRTGYIALKENEIYNLRQTALLIHLGFDPNEIIANLEIVP